MPNTTNFNWPTPADTDLVKDGAAAIRNLGNGVDTSLVDLKGGTTGQILSKASNADMDFTFITPNVGDITEVQAGTGISVASGTGPIPVVTNSMATEITAKGDLIVGTGSGTFDNLPAGTNGYTLVADSAETTGLKWAAPAAGGKVLQVVQDDLTSTVSTTSTSYVDVTGFAVTITPSSASSKVLIICSFNHQIVRSGSPTAMQGAINLVRTSTQIQENIYGFEAITNSAGGTPEFFSNGNFSYLDAPNTTSAVTYKVQQKAQTNMTAYFQASATKIASIIAMEIGA